jgi:hypothetical protein
VDLPKGSSQIQGSQNHYNILILFGRKGGARSLDLRIMRSDDEEQAKKLPVAAWSVVQLRSLVARCFSLNAR